MSEFTEITREGLIDMLEESQELIAAGQEKIEELQSTNARLIAAAAGRGMVSEMDNPQEAAVLVRGLHDEIAQLKADRENAYKEIREYNMPMECGHLARYAVSDEDGTQWCVMCDRKALFKAGEDTLQYITSAKHLLSSIQWNGESAGWLACPSCHKLKKRWTLKRLRSCSFYG